jgi:Family of unknown function (DUF5681)
MDTTMPDVDTSLVEVKRGRFQKGESGNPDGRPVGAYNRYTRVIKEALIIAAELEGSNGNGKGKLIGYMRKVAREDMRAFCMMLSRAMPTQVAEQRTMETKEEVVYQSVEEVQREMASRGISLEVMFKLMRDEPRPLDDMDTMGTVIDAE